MIDPGRSWNLPSICKGDSGARHRCSSIVAWYLLGAAACISYHEIMKNESKTQRHDISYGRIMSSNHPTWTKRICIKYAWMDASSRLTQIFYQRIFQPVCVCVNLEHVENIWVKPCLREMCWAILLNQIHLKGQAFISTHRTFPHSKLSKR